MNIMPDTQREAVNWSEFKIAVPVAVAFAVLFVLLQKAGLVNLISDGGVTYSTAFVIGIVASLSTCMAVVGGIVLSMSATLAKSGGRLLPQLVFHVGRLVAFFVLGGVIGAIGSAFTLSSTAALVLGLIIGVVMLALGLNLLDVPWVSRIVPRMPDSVSSWASRSFGARGWVGPLLVGVATFFLPCGFTQSMQVYTLSTGSFLAGGLTMLAFALGTLPALAVLSFGSVSARASAWSGVFFKTAGLVVIALALLNIANAFAAAGIIPSFLTL